MKRHLKPLISGVILLATLAAFIYYVHTHPAIISQLRHMPLFTLIALLVLYAVWFAGLALVTRASLRLFDKHMPLKENFLFNAYSTLINFFGPGQSGPIFRGAYLKKKHGIGVKQYVFSLLVYYVFYGLLSMGMILVGTRPWWQTLLVLSAAIGGGVVVLRWYKQKYRDSMAQAPLLRLPTLGFLFAMTALQLGAQALIFGIELHGAGAGASIGHMLAYTGIANFALFVALTPGAIGIREAFLAFSQSIHHIDGPAIVAANIVDRAAFLAFLGVLFVLVIGLHAKSKLGIR